MKSIGRLNPQPPASVSIRGQTLWKNQLWQPAIGTSQSRIKELPHPFAIPLRDTPAPKVLRHSAQGCRALASASLGQQAIAWKANPALRRTQPPPAASATSPEACLLHRSLHHSPIYDSELKTRAIRDPFRSLQRQIGRAHV